MKSIARCLACLIALIAGGPGDAVAEGAPGSFDYYVLAMSWSPSYCETQGRGRRGEPQCSGERPYSFVLHGLWPQYQRGWPEFCRTEERPWVPDGLIRDMLDIMPSKRLIINEYRKHGTCSGLGPAEYFSAARRLFERIKIPVRFQKPNDYATVSPGQIEADFLAANPELKPDMISVTCNRHSLGELRVCFSRDLHPTPCGSNERQDKLCSSDKIVMPPVRSGAPRYRGGGDDDEERDDGRER